MNILHTPHATTGLEPTQRFVLDCVSWAEYEKFLEAVGKRRVRLTYDRGRLEFMTVSSLHERYKHLFCLLLAVVALETGARVVGVGSTTFRRRDVGARTGTGRMLLPAKRVAGARHDGARSRGRSSTRLGD